MPHIYTDDDIIASLQLGTRIRDWRQAEGWKQTDLARKTGSGQNRVSDWELGIHEPSLTSLRRIAAAFGVTVAQLLDGIM